MSTLEVKAIQAPTGYDLDMPAGHSVQVVSFDTSTRTTTSSTSYVTANTGISFTPKFASSKILIQCTMNVYVSGDYCYMSIAKDGTEVTNGEGLSIFHNGTHFHNETFQWIEDSANTTARTYSLVFKVSNANYTAYSSWSSTAASSTQNRMIITEVAG
jgi:hypothetical protein